MVTAIYKHISKRDDTDRIKEAVNDTMVCRLYAEDVGIDYREIVSDAWTDKEIDAVEQAAKIANVGSAQQSCRIPVFVEHEALPAPLDECVSFTINAPLNRDVMWPKKWRMVNVLLAGSKEHPRINQVADYVAYTALERWLLRDTVSWMLANSTNYDQCFWMLPAWLPIMRRAGMGDQANAVADCKRPKIMPAIPPHIRPRLRWLNTFLTAHELMGTFENNRKERELIKDQCTLSLASQETYNVKMGEVQVKVGLC